MLERRDFVEAAPTLPRRPAARAASSFTPPLRRQGNGRSHTSIRANSASRRTIRPVMQHPPAEEPGVLALVSCCLSAAGIRFLGILSRPGIPPLLRSAYRTASSGADPSGFSMFRTHETRLGPGALCTPGTTAPTRPGTIPSRRPPPSSGRSLSPRHHDPSRDVQLTRHLQEFTGVHPRPAFPSPVAPGRIGDPWAFPRAPHPPAQETGTHVAAGTGLTALTRTTSSTSSRTSNRRTHSLRATSCRN